MRYQVRIRGTSPLITHNGAAGLDNRSPANIEKATLTKKRGTNRTESDDDRIRELECYTSLYLTRTAYRRSPRQLSERASKELPAS